MNTPTRLLQLSSRCGQYAISTQDKMKKVLDLWSKNSTFPPLMLAKLKGLVNEVDSSAQGAYFDRFLSCPVYSTCEIASHTLRHPSTVYTQSNATLCVQRTYQYPRNPLFLHGMMKTERSTGDVPCFSFSQNRFTNSVCGPASRNKYQFAVSAAWGNCRSRHPANERHAANKRHTHQRTPTCTSCVASDDHSQCICNTDTSFEHVECLSFRKLGVTKHSTDNSQ